MWRAEAVEGHVPQTNGTMQHRSLQHLALGVLLLAAYQSQLVLIQHLVESFWHAAHTFLVHVDLKSQQLERQLRDWSAAPRLSNVHAAPPSFCGGGWFVFVMTMYDVPPFLYCFPVSAHRRSCLASQN